MLTTCPAPPQALDRIVRLDAGALSGMFDKRAIVACVKEALIAQANGRFVQPAPTHLSFDHGDCHVKCGFERGGTTFTVKVATGFHANYRLGLPNASGMMLLFDQATGMPLGVFEDDGLLTAWRTTAAAVLAAQAGAPMGRLRVGIVGAGMQAAQVAAWLPAFCDVGEVRIWSRSGSRAEAMARELPGTASAELDLPSLCRWANLIVTTTPSSVPLVMTDWVAPGTHLVALGADNPGKVEIDPALVGRCATIMTDDHEQCLGHGDFGAAVRAGRVSDRADIPLGLVLAGTMQGRPAPDAVTLADLTGLAAQDDAIARLFHALAA